MINPLLGVAVGDAIGAPFEMMKPTNPVLLAWDGESFEEPKVKHLVGVVERFQFTDDTQMTLALVESAKWCFFTTDTFKDAIRAAIRLGGDTDTRAAIVGGWAGIRYGVPADWARQVEDYDRILSLEDQLLKGGA